LVGPVASACAELAALVPQRDRTPPEPMRRPPAPAPPEPESPLQPGHVFSALAQRLPADAVVIEETPSSQPELYQRIPIRRPLGFVSTANGGLGFGISGAIGLRMGLPNRPVVALLGDGSSMYAIQALWSAAKYEVGALLVVLANGRYAIMDILAKDALAKDAGGAGPWPAFDGVDIAGIARCLGCPATRVQTHDDELLGVFDEVVPGLADRRQPLLVEVVVG
jgi:benzoylformate decarboxylase